MELDGRKDMQLQSVSINGEPLAEGAYDRQPALLTIKSPPAGEFDLEIVTIIKPQENTLLEGLYKSGGNFCSQARLSCKLLQLFATARHYWSQTASLALQTHMQFFIALHQACWTCMLQFQCQ